MKTVYKVRLYKNPFGQFIGIEKSDQVEISTNETININYSSKLYKASHLLAKRYAPADLSHYLEHTSTDDVHEVDPHTVLIKVNP